MLPHLPTLFPILSAEHDRVASLRAHRILDRTPEIYFETIVADVAQELRCSIAKINLIDSDRQWTMAAFGADAGRSIARSLGFCSHTILNPSVVTLVPDALDDVRFSENPMVTGAPALRFYAGAALTDSEGRALGALAVMDTHPGKLNEKDVAKLRFFADAASSRIRTYAPSINSRDRDEHYRYALDSNLQIAWTAFPDGMVEETSPRWNDLTGMKHETARGSGWTAAVHPDDLDATLLKWHQCVRSGAPMDGEYRVLTRNANYRWFRVRASARHDALGNIIRWYGTLEDIHEDKLAATVLLESEHRLRYALEVGGLGAWEYDVLSQAITASDLCAQAFGLSSGVDLSSYQVVIERIHPDDRKLLHLERDRVLGGDYQMDFELRSIWLDGSVHWVRLTGGARVGVDGTTDKAFGLALDVTERKLVAEERERSRQRLIHLVYHDEMTGLGNRRLLDAKILSALAETRSDAQAALLCIDLDEFKNLNDRLGQDVGDLLLRQVADRFCADLPPGSVIARTGGDEFAVFLFPVHDLSTAEATAHRLLEALTDPIELEGRPLVVGASVGIAITADCSWTVDQLRRNAETALYRAKKSGRNTYRVFEPQMDARLQVREALKSDLQDALTQEQLSLFYQPLVELESGLAVGFEALMRWKHPQRGWIAPEEFIPLAEETGWITRLGRWALQEACREAASWPENIRVAVNLSAVQFASGELLEDVRTALDSTGLAGDRLELEVTETLLLHDSAANLAMLAKLRKLGPRIVMDDFGTGYSSLAYLRKFRFDKIKIDKSLVVGLPDNQGGDTIVQAILGLGRSLGVAVTAEGLEHPAQLQFFLRNKCLQGQGYLFSPPVPKSRLRELFGQKLAARHEG